MTKKLEKSNHTQVPNDFFDEMKNLKGSEIQVFLAICRKTRGWHKDTDRISISQLQEMTGLSNKAVIEASQSLEKKGLIQSERAIGKSTVYEIAYEESSQVSKAQPMKKVHSTYEESSQVTYEESSHTKERVKETNKRKGARVNGCPVPGSLQQPEIVEAYLLYCNYLKESWHRWPTSTTTQMDLAKLQELQESGNDPVKVIQQTIQGRNKSFFPVRDFEKKSPDAEINPNRPYYKDL